MRTQGVVGREVKKSLSRARLMTRRFLKIPRFRDSSKNRSIKI